MKYLSTSLASLLLVLTSSIALANPATAETASARNDAAKAAMDKQIAFMEETLGKLKAAKTDQERTEIINSQRQTMREMMSSRMKNNRMGTYPQHQRPFSRPMPQMRNQAPMQQPQWQPPRQPRPAQNNMTNKAYEYHMKNMQRQIKMMNEQMQYQQKMLQEIMSYRAPLEKMLKEDNNNIPAPAPVAPAPVAPTAPAPVAPH